MAASPSCRRRRRAAAAACALAAWAAGPGRAAAGGAFAAARGRPPLRWVGAAGHQPWAGAFRAKRPPGPPTWHALPAGAEASVADAAWAVLVEPPVSALNAASAPELRDVAWVDFRCAVAFFVLAPLALLAAGIWGSVKDGPKEDEVLRAVSGYWQCSSLLLITVLLNIAGAQAGAVTGFLAQVMILVSLWFWEDISTAVAEQQSGLATAFRAWRLVATALAAAGAVCQVGFLYCAAVPSLAADAGCAAWIEAPLAFRDLLLPAADAELCGRLGFAALAIYCGYLAYFAAVVLPRIGRSGLAPRPAFTWVAPLEWLGLARPRGAQHHTATATAAEAAPGPAESRAHRMQGRPANVRRHRSLGLPSHFKLFYSG